MRRTSLSRQGSSAPKTCALITVLVALACAAALAFWLLAAIPQRAADGGATVSDYAGMTREEIQAELDRQVADSMMTVTVSPRAFVHEEGWVELALANDARNKVQQRFTLVQEGKAVYESGIVAPGRELSSFEVKGLAPGKATVLVQGVDAETGSAVGSSANVEIEVVKAPDGQEL